MSNLYILQNQQGYYLKKMGADKTLEWVDGQEPNQLFRTIHKDEAVNMMCETNSQDVELRMTIKEYPAHAKKYPIIPIDDLPPPLAKQEIALSVSDSDNTLPNEASSQESFSAESIQPV